MIHIYRVRTANPDIKQKSHDQDNAYLTGKAQADELVLHGIIVPDGSQEYSNNLTVHFYRKAD